MIYCARRRSPIVRRRVRRLHPLALTFTGRPGNGRPGDRYDSLHPRQRSSDTLRS